MTWINIFKGGRMFGKNLKKASVYKGEDAMSLSYFLGIDVGTQGARVVLLDVEGNMMDSSEESFPLNDHSREEQSPDVWWNACVRSLKNVLDGARQRIDLKDVKAVSVTSTSGTVIPLDENDQPLHNAIMYSDQRSVNEAKICQEAALKYHQDGYTGFNTSSGLSKMVWFVHNFPEKAKRLARWCHATDYIIGRLSGNWNTSDYTNVLKSGYDVRNVAWPEYLFDHLPLKREWLPKVIPSGEPIATILPFLAAKFGLGEDLQVVAGMTDGCASQIAAGAVNLGDWNTTIGTTLVVKGVTENEIMDTEGRLYCHRHPEGYWMPGGASNTGADWITNGFSDNLEALNMKAGKIIPTGHMAYPLCREGERFPFIAPQARGFMPEGLLQVERFAANMEGVAYVERYAYELIRHLSGENMKSVFTAGGGSNSDTWLTIRSNVLNLPVYKMKHVTGAVGAAILAASKTHFKSIIEATKALTQVEKEIHPSSALSKSYDNGYREFIQKLLAKGYIPDYQYA